MGKNCQDLSFLQILEMKQIAEIWGVYIQEKWLALVRILSFGYISPSNLKPSQSIFIVKLSS